jgi:hypothetical protein
MSLSLAEHNPENSELVSHDPSILSTGRVGSGQWEVVYPPPEADPGVPPEKTPSATAAAVQSGLGPEVPDGVPTGVTQHLIPITTGAGRTYLLSLGAENPQKMYLFQIPSSKRSAASIKDIIRDKVTNAISSIPDTWKSGKHEWSKIEIVKESKEKDKLVIPDESLGVLAVAGWEEYGDRIVLWGSVGDGNEAKDEGWMVSFN